jgi:hypothetical protein
MLTFISINIKTKFKRFIVITEKTQKDTIERFKAYKIQRIVCIFTY